MADITIKVATEIVPASAADMVVKDAVDGTGTHAVALAGEICKSEHRLDHQGREYRYVLGPVLIPNRLDLQKDWVSPDAVEDACHRFMMKYQFVSDGHQRLVKASDAVIVENYITPIDLKISNHEIPKGTWMMGARIYDKGMMSQVDSGKYRGFSVEGDALHIPKTYQT